MKRALVILNNKLLSSDVDAHVVANVHDEWQIETPAHYADTVGRIGVRSIRIAGETLSLRCPLDGEYRVGNNWAETH